MNISNEKLDIIIQGGQSNAEGCGFGEVSVEYTPDADILYMNAPKSVNVLYAGTPEEKLVIEYSDEPFSYSVADNHMNGELLRGDFALSFAKKYKESGMLASGRKLLIIRAAIGGTGFYKHHWGKNDFVYLKMIEMIKEALSQNADNRVVAFLWHQGEHDAFEENAPAVFKESLSYLLSEVRKICGGIVPFVTADFVNEWKSQNIEKCEPIVAAIREVVADAKNAAFVETSDLPSNNQKNGGGDGIHFCRESLRILGERYFEAYKKIRD